MKKKKKKEKTKKISQNFSKPFPFLSLSLCFSKLTQMQGKQVPPTFPPAFQTPSLSPIYPAEKTTSGSRLCFIVNQRDDGYMHKLRGRGVERSFFRRIKTKK